MSLTFEIRGKSTATWPLTYISASQIARLSTGDTKIDADSIFGGKDDGPGIERRSNRLAILEAANRVLPIAKKLPSGFQLHSPAYEKYPEQIGGSGLGAFINGKGYSIRCFDNYWEIRSYDEIKEMTRTGTYKEVPKHYEPAEIATDNRGIIKIEPRKRGGRDLAWLLRQIKKFLESDPSEEVTIIWG